MTKLNTLTMAALAALVMTACGEADRDGEAGVPAAPPRFSAPPAASQASDPAADASGSRASLPLPGSAPPLATPAEVAAERSGQFEACLASGDAGRGVTAAMAACIGAELQAQDARLNVAYREALPRLDEAGQARLRDEERAWIRQRDAACDGARTGGTIDRVVVPSCLLDATIRRRLALESAAR